jgi:mRNA interferase HigB
MFYLRLVGLDIIKEAQRRHSIAAKRLATFVAVVGSKTTVWASFQDVRAFYPSADKVGDHYVFDIGGNRFRLIAKINFAAGVVVVRWFGTHAEYDKIDVEEV